METNAPPPFNKQCPDMIIIKSSDGVQFCVNTFILGLVSPLFRDASTLPPPAGPENTHSDLQILDATEDSQTLERLLCLIYPGESPIFTSIAEVGPVLKAAAKYQIVHIVAQLRRGLTVFDDALRLYAIACSPELQFEEEARDATLEWCEDPRATVQDYVPDMDAITAAQYFRLLEFHSMHTVGRDISEPFTFCNPPPNTAAGDGMQSDFIVPSSFAHPSISSDTVILRSYDYHDFYVNKVVIELASETLAQRLVHTSPSDSISDDGHRIIALPLDGRTLLRLLQLCYPNSDPATESWDTLTADLRLAHEYQITGAKGTAKRMLMEHVETHPLQVYLLAAHYGWPEESAHAGKYAMLLSADSYVPEMECVSARIYRRFLLHRQAWRSAVAEVASELLGGLSHRMEKPYGSIFWSDLDVRHRPEYRLHVHALLLGTNMLRRAAGAGGGGGVRSRITEVLFAAAVSPARDSAIDENRMQRVLRRILEKAPDEL
ncbi:uncharacterized protein LAESUDRAFT_727717 [Laetiporus sulphureus 93-53]|uniref:BTB domain-containing protein n=1 Tax=Laetiporus sulphureus 93-53 TaxID=1314785 RepID=A0A165DGT6_9APHY|nr:uncharacterized protein LAESUDRAFT_727717 [Laetiporus sulphureus 93-53]KZT04848.1 hypothetical protein LAESUDRAFT_727717 [Laetiporus sulphureus 93-53]